MAMQICSGPNVHTVCMYNPTGADLKSRGVYGIEPLHLSLLSELNKGLGTG